MKTWNSRACIVSDYSRTTGQTIKLGKKHPLVRGFQFVRRDCQYNPFQEEVINQPACIIIHVACFFVSMKYVSRASGVARRGLGITVVGGSGVRGSIRYE